MRSIIADADRMFPGCVRESAYGNPVLTLGHSEMSVYGQSHLPREVHACGLAAIRAVFKSGAWREAGR